MRAHPSVLQAGECERFPNNCVFLRMRNNLLPLLPLLFITTLAPALRAQTELWTGMSFEHEVNPRFGYAFEGEHRAPVGNFVNGETLLHAIGNVFLGEGLNGALGTRYQARRGDGDEYRVWADLNLKRELGDGPWTLATRLRYQQDRLTTGESEGRQNAFRALGAVTYTLTDGLDLAAEYEVRYRFDLGGWERWRYTLGVEIALADNLDLDVFYRLDDPVMESGRVPIVGLFIAYVLPDRREREWDYRRPFGRRFIW